jgi:hypothetical protein
LRTQRQLNAGKPSAFCLKHHLPNEKALDTMRIAQSPRSQYSKAKIAPKLPSIVTHAKHVSFDVWQNRAK